MENLVTFGNYLLSEERTESFRQNPLFKDELLLKERLSQVTDADIENWKEKQK